MTFELICWPDIQMYMEYQGFVKNACLADYSSISDRLVAMLCIRLRTLSLGE